MQTCDSSRQWHNMARLAKWIQYLMQSTLRYSALLGPVLCTILEKALSSLLRRFSGESNSKTWKTHYKTELPTNIMMGWSVLQFCFRYLTDEKTQQIKTCTIWTRYDEGNTLPTTNNTSKLWGLLSFFSPDFSLLKT